MADVDEVVVDEYDEDEDSMKDRYLTFRVGEEVFGIEIMYVTEIVGMQVITEIPDMPGYVRGVVNLRGQVIPVVDIRARFSMEPREYNDRTCIVVVRCNEKSIGIIVDMVNEVMDIPAEDVSAPPKIGSGQAEQYICGMGKVDGDVKILLDVNKLLFEEELALLGA